MLDVCVIEQVDVLRIIQLAVGAVAGDFYRFCPARRLQSSSVKLSSVSRVLVQLDGENAGELPVTFSVLPKVLRVIAS